MSRLEGLEAHCLGRVNCQPIYIHVKITSLTPIADGFLGKTKLVNSNDLSIDGRQIYKRDFQTIKFDDERRVQTKDVFVSHEEFNREYKDSLKMSERLSTLYDR